MGTEDSWEQMLRRLLGDQNAERAIEQIRNMGVDPAVFMGNLPSDPTVLEHLSHQVREMFNEDPLNWKAVADLARMKIATDPQISATQAARGRQALTVADLWLDSATALTPKTPERTIWSRATWISKTLSTWKTLTEPVARRAISAVTSSIEGTIAAPLLGEGLLGDLQPQQVSAHMAGSVFGAQIGQAIGTLASEAFGSTDTGLPLSGESVTALVYANVEAFGEDLDISSEDVLMFLAVREAAHARLFTAAPWLRSYLLRAIEKYASQIEFDMSTVIEKLQQVDGLNPNKIQELLVGSINATADSRKQLEARSEVETILAVIEGWVEVVTGQACAPFMASIHSLREMMRRRRAIGGPAEKVLAQLIGLELRPKRARDAAQIWELLTTKLGVEERDKLWSHPDVMITKTELENPNDFLTNRRAAAAADAKVDADLAAILEGTLGYAEGLNEGEDSPGDSRQTPPAGEK
ncbi:MAG: zinc-dependent metalloprotease [Actinomycetaceae bacterium]|nr:zinc-dependent metalloprotease [Actinomycetaceae bacterium]